MKKKSKDFKVCIVIPYFGKMPSYFQLFLKSCEFNVDFNWLIFTDDNTEYRYPVNVKKVFMTFDECKNIIQSKFSFKIELEYPKKLCDFKCAYGYIFHEYLNEYDFWGYCDLDIIWGDLKSFITDDMLEKYDKLFSLGHLTLYKNNDNINTLFMKSINGIDRYKQVFTTKEMCCFDEWSKNNINEIFINENIPMYLESNVADIGAYNCSFLLSIFKADSMKWCIDEVKNSIFKWDRGKIIRVWVENNKLIEKEYSYIHIQKRKMKNKIRSIDCEEFYIVPNKFICLNNAKLKKYIRLYQFKCILNYKLLNKKINEFKYKIIVTIRKYFPKKS